MSTRHMKIEQENPNQQHDEQARYEEIFITARHRVIVATVNPHA